MKQLCFGCMQSYDTEFDVCPHCGYVQNTPPKEAYQIVPGTTLHERYLVGRVLGSGGFGITYIGYDLILAKKVAIKEYFPVQLATRMPAQTKVTVYTGEKQEQFTAGMKKALDEGKRLAEFRQVKGITQILDFFEENATAYIVMELLQGETLKSRLKRQEKMAVEEALPVVLAVSDALEQVHAKNIIHRDIAPDNIYLLEDGTVKLLDFGASRQVVASQSKSLTVILKMGYAPVEQYQSNGNQGPWTDVYGLAATFYRMITGKKPPEAQERRLEDTLKEPSKLGVQIEKHRKRIDECAERAAGGPHAVGGGIRKTVALSEGGEAQCLKEGKAGRIMAHVAESGLHCRGGGCGRRRDGRGHMAAAVRRRDCGSGTGG